MPDIRAVKNGVWSDATVWTPNPPAAGDVVRPNNFTVTIDVNVSVTEIRNDAGGGAVANGSFTLNDGVTVTASNGFFGSFNANNLSGGLINYSGTLSATLNGQINQAISSAVAISCVQNLSTGTITINGNVVSAAGGNQNSTLRNTSTGTFIINGNLTNNSTSSCIINLIGTSTINGGITTNSGTAITNTSGTINISGGTYSSSGGAILTNTTGTATINGNVSATSVSAILGIIVNSGSGTITFISSITNNLTGGTGNLVVNSGSGIINVTGNLTGAAIGNNANANTIINSSTGTVNVTGNVTANSTNASGTISRSLTIENSGGGTINVTGTVTGPQSTPAITLNNVCNAIRNSGNGTVNIIGNIVGTLGGFNVLTAVANISTGPINITGNATGGSTGLAVANTSTGTINLNGNAIGGTSFFAIEGVSSAGNTIIERAVYSNLGQSPITGYIKFKTTNPEIDVLRTDNVIVTLRDPLNVSGLLPLTSDVRSGTTYNTGSSTGTLAMPAANLVQLGVPVGATFGTANLTPADFWNYLISNGFTPGSIGQRLKETATTDIVGKLIQSFS
jgi:fibronectin-binding autotransporter adhesin